MHTFTALATAAFKMQFVHLCPDSSAALCNACQLKINRHLVANLKPSQAVELRTVHSNLEPQRSCYHCTSYAQQAFSWSEHPGAMSRNARPVIWTEILQLRSFLTVFLLTMCILHAKLRPGQANSLIFFPSHCTPQEGSVMCSIGQPLGIWVWALFIWRRLETQVTPSWITALISLVYHKKWHKHSYQAALKRQEYSPLGQLCGKEKYF